VLDTLRTPEGGWGYPFGWQSRAFYASPNTPNLICTALAVKAYRRFGRECDTGFMEGLVTERGGETWIRYIPQSDTQVHNINLMGAALLGRRDCVEFSVKRQRPDGSWWYGEAENQRGSTIFTPATILSPCANTSRRPATPALRMRPNGDLHTGQSILAGGRVPALLSQPDYPIDIHCCAQGILTYLTFGDVAKADGVARWALKNMWDERGFFWYQHGRLAINRIQYLRWSQAWMYYALGELIKAKIE